MANNSILSASSGGGPSSNSTLSIAPKTELFRMFYGTGPSAWLILLFGLKVVIASIGIFLNGNLVYVTLRRKSLHSVCNLLIAFYALCTIFQQANFFVTFSIVLSGRNFIAYSSCFLLQLLPIFCSFAAFPLTFFIAIERFLAIFCPIWYKWRKKAHVLAPMLAISAILGFYVTYKDMQTALDTPDLPVICAVGPKNDDSWVTYLILAMNLVSIAAYLSIWIRVKMAANQFTTYQKRLLQCLFVLLLLELFGWSLSILLRLTIGPLFHLQSGTFLNFLIINLTTNLAYIAMSMNLPVLYVYSKEHREMLRKHFGKIKLGVKLLFSSPSPQNNTVYVNSSAQNRSQAAQSGRQT